MNDATNISWWAAYAPNGSKLFQSTDKEACELYIVGMEPGCNVKQCPAPKPYNYNPGNRHFGYNVND